MVQKKAGELLSPPADAHAALSPPILCYLPLNLPMAGTQPHTYYLMKLCYIDPPAWQSGSH